MGLGFQFVGGKILQLESPDNPSGVDGAESMGRVVAPERAQQTIVPLVAAASVKPTKSTRDASTIAITPNSVQALARRRVREIRRELAKIPKLQRELDELQRMLDAASVKPVAAVRDIGKRSLAG